jgi:hypothetical protein
MRFWCFLMVLFSINILKVVGSETLEPTVKEFTEATTESRNSLVFSLNFKSDDTLSNRLKFDAYFEICESRKDHLSKVRLMYLKYRERINFGLKPHEEESLLKDALHISKKNGYFEEEIVFNHYYQFFLYYNINNDADKLYVFVLKEFEDISNFGVETFKDYDIGRLLSHMGRFVYELGDYVNALKILNTAKQYIKPDSENLFIYVKVLNNIQVIYKNQKEYSKALEYAEKIKDATKKCEEEPDFCHFWQGLSRLDMADIFLSKNQPFTAEKLAEEGYRFIRDRKAYNHNIEAEYDALTVLIRIKLNFAKYNEAENLLSRQKIIFDSLQNKEDFYFKKINYYDQYAVLAEYKNDFAKAIAYRNLSQPIKDSLNIRNDARKIEQLNQKHKIETLQNSLLLIEKDKKINVWIRNAALLLLLLSGSLFYIRYLTLRNREKAQKKQLENAKNNLKILTENLQDKSELLEQLKSELAKVHSDADRQNILETLHQYTILKDEDWHDFKVLFEKVYPNFISDTKMIYQDITPAETRILVLEKLNFSLQAMANTLGVGKSTIHQTKYRLKKKVGMQENIDAELHESRT